MIFSRSEYFLFTNSVLYEIIFSVLENDFNDSINLLSEAIGSGKEVFVLDLFKPIKRKKIYEWQKEHLPNLTGTAFAVKPQGSLLDKGFRQKSAADYETWTPKK